MDKIIVFIIILIAIINAIVRAFKEKQAKERGPKAPPKERVPSLLEQFLKRLHVEGLEEPISTLEEELPAKPLPEKKPIRIEEQVKEVKPTLAEQVASYKPEEPTAEEPAFKPSFRPPKPKPPEAEKTITPTIEVTADTAREGIIMAEILGPALAKRRMGIRSRRLF